MKTVSSIRDHEDHHWACSLCSWQTLSSHRVDYSSQRSFEVNAIVISIWNWGNGWSEKLTPGSWTVGWWGGEAGLEPRPAALKPIDFHGSLLNIRFCVSIWGRWRDGGKTIGASNHLPSKLNVFIPWPWGMGPWSGSWRQLGKKAEANMDSTIARFIPSSRSTSQ